MNELKNTEKILQFSGCKLTPKGAQFENNLTFEQWQTVGKTLGFMGNSMQLWIGDWINFGERMYGEKYAQAIEESGYDYAALRNMAYVSSKVDLSRRRDNLSFSHHQEVASLEPKKQEEMLEKASKEKISVKEFRTVLKKEKLLSSPLDKTGFAIPELILEDWNRAEEFSVILRQISYIKCTIEAGLNDSDMIFREINNTTLAGIQNAYGSLKRVIPYAVCTSCSGHNRKKCTLCKGRGWLSEFIWKTGIPQEMKDIRAKLSK